MIHFRDTVGTYDMMMPTRMGARILQERSMRRSRELVLDRNWLVTEQAGGKRKKKEATVD